MTGTIRRGRGRPPRDDDETLAEAAYLVATKAAPTVRSALVRALGRPGDSDIRRLQRKWLSRTRAAVGRGPAP
jgi:hypothetical protein